MPDIFKLHIDERRIFGLDLLRAAAIFFVVFLHGILVLPGSLAPIQFVFVLDGVSIFFVLSGFLIGKIIITDLCNKNVSIKTIFLFWSRRWWRTLPNYFLILSVALTLDALSTKTAPWPETINYYFFLQNFYSPQPSFFGQAWSLSVEEWFYIILPCLCIALSQFKRISAANIILYCAISIIIFSICSRWLRYATTDIHSLHDADNMLKKQVIMRLDSIMYGVLGAYVALFHRGFWIRCKEAALVTGVCILVYLKVADIKNWHHSIGFFRSVFATSLFEIGILCLLPYFVTIKKGRGLFGKLITYVSITSYSIYLIHFSIVKVWIVDHLGRSGLRGNYLLILQYLCYWSLSFLLAILLYKYFEKPVTELRPAVSPSFKKLIIN